MIGARGPSGARRDPEGARRAEVARLSGELAGLQEELARLEGAQRGQQSRWQRCADALRPRSPRLRLLVAAALGFAAASVAVSVRGRPSSDDGVPGYGAETSTSPEPWAPPSLRSLTVSFSAADDCFARLAAQELAGRDRDGEWITAAPRPDLLRLYRIGGDVDYARRQRTWPTAFASARWRYEIGRVPNAGRSLIVVTARNQDCRIGFDCDTDATHVSCRPGEDDQAFEDEAAAVVSALRAVCLDTGRTAQEIADSRLAVRKTYDALPEP